MPECEHNGGCPYARLAGMCNNSCYATYSRELTARWKAEDDEREARGAYLGCPVCKQEVRFNCHHDGQDISSVELPLPVPPRPPTLDEAVTLLRAARGEAMTHELHGKIVEFLERADGM